ncbi:hypothetical protein P5757_09580 [Bacillus tropicus]|uniref:hypothetical protein n=1 Tax=Bacillus tropicus TaxID=2026188 RepID=UPI00240759E5|nr:hypothetical protein [Bacillus tropicus]MDF9556299.1 hypothetical protein [Bacillus tropicus]MDF9589045.1 hypothetical protein [Bacillus tropicus]MDF9646218.1 hypothetical protein [Bacillus tropicus]
MIIKYHGQHVTITGDEDILQRAGITVEASKLRKGETPTSYKELRYFYERAYKKKTKDDAMLYVIARENYIAQNDQRSEKAKTKTEKKTNNWKKEARI